MALARMHGHVHSDEDRPSIIARELRSSNPVIRASAARALSVVGDAATRYLDEHATCFEDRCPAVRAAAVSAMALLGKPGRVYAPAIAGMLNDEFAKVRIAAINSLSAMGDHGA